VFAGMLSTLFGVGEASPEVTTVDMKTGRHYESLEEAEADGVPHSRLIQTDAYYWKRLDTSKYQPHQGDRERKRRAAKVSA
jgi:hypothetical protein